MSVAFDAPHAREPVIVDAVRTPVGRRHGALRERHAASLLADVLNALVARNGIAPGSVDDVVAGCATQIGEQAGNVARAALLVGGFPVTVPGTTVQRACGSSQQALHFAANLIATGTCDTVIAAGVELMSKTAGANDDARYGRRYPDELVERFALPTMGIAAERIARHWGLARRTLDALSLRSHQLAAAAQDNGYFVGQLLPVAAVDGTTLTADEGVRRDTSSEKLAGLAPSFDAKGVVTAGNASQISDGAAGLLLMSRAQAARTGLRARARIVVQRVVGVDPGLMLTGPIPATRQILERAGLRVADIDLFEINEAFASVLGAWLAELDPDLERVNVNGGSIALGHPLGSTGARLFTVLINELERRDARYGLVSMCCGGGLGTATLVERLGPND